jgi:hypothetical protein
MFIHCFNVKHSRHGMILIIFFFFYPVPEYAFEEDTSPCHVPVLNYSDTQDNTKQSLVTEQKRCLTRTDKKEDTYKHMSCQCLFGIIPITYKYNSSHTNWANILLGYNTLFSSPSILNPFESSPLINLMRQLLIRFVQAVQQCKTIGKPVNFLSY